MYLTSILDSIKINNKKTIYFTLIHDVSCIINFIALKYFLETTNLETFNLIISKSLNIICTYSKTTNTFMFILSFFREILYFYPGK